MKTGITLSHSEALRHLKKEKPIEAKGTLKIQVRNFTITVAAEEKFLKSGPTIYYRVFLPSIKRDLHTKDWNKVIQVVTTEAGILAASTSGMITYLKDEEAFHYNMLKKAASECRDRKSLARLIQAVGLAFGKELTEYLADPLSGILLARDSDAPFSEIVQDGLGFQKFAKDRPYMRKDAFFPFFAEILPNATTLPPNQKLLEDYLYQLRNSICDDTWVQYESYIRRFSDAIDKPFLFVNINEVDSFVEGLTIKPTELGNKVVKTTYRHIRNVLRSFFTWLIEHKYRPRVLGNPVIRKRIGPRGRTANPDHIISPADLQLWLDNVRWEDLPYLVCTAIMGIRPETVERLHWENFDWDRGWVEITGEISKCGEAYPPITPLIREMLSRYRKMKGPVVFCGNSSQRVKGVAKALGFVTEFHNHARKSAISYTWKMLMEQYHDEKRVEALMSEWFGNSDEVRRHYYKVKVEHADALAYLACKRVITEHVISPNDVEHLRQRQIMAWMDTYKAISAKTKRHNKTTPEWIVENITEEGLGIAQGLFQVSRLPEFIKVSESVPDRLKPIKPWKRKTVRAAPRIMQDLSELLRNRNNPQTYMVFN